MRKYDEQTVIDVCWGSIHHLMARRSGAHWERAHYVHRSYVRGARRQTPVSIQCYLLRMRVRSARPFKLTAKAVHKEI